MDSQRLGRKGEAVAAKYYLDRGFTLLEHNYRTRMGELDLILRKGELLVIAEVKTRSSSTFGQPCEAVSPYKQKRMILAARQYLRRFSQQEPRLRFDVVEVFPEQGRYRVHCIPAAFEG